AGGTPVVREVHAHLEVPVVVEGDVAADFEGGGHDRRHGSGEGRRSGGEKKREEERRRQRVTGTKETPVGTNSSGSFFPCFWFVACTLIAAARAGSFSTGANSHSGFTSRLNVLVRW